MSTGLHRLYILLWFCLSFRHLMKTGKKMNPTITTMWKTVLKRYIGGGERKENGMTWTVKTNWTGFVKFDEVKRFFVMGKKSLEKRNQIKTKSSWANSIALWCQKAAKLLAKLVNINLHKEACYTETLKKWRQINLKGEI